MLELPWQIRKLEGCAYVHLHITVPLSHVEVAHEFVMWVDLIVPSRNYRFLALFLCSKYIGRKVSSQTCGNLIWNRGRVVFLWTTRRQEQHKTAGQFQGCAWSQKAMNDFVRTHRAEGTLWSRQVFFILSTSNKYISLRISEALSKFSRSDTLSQR